MGVVALTSCLDDGMCRNITTLRGLHAGSDPEEIEAAARQYVRKVSGVQATSAASEAAFELAVARVTEATTELLDSLPPRQGAAEVGTAAAPPQARRLATGRRQRSRSVGQPEPGEEVLVSRKLDQ